MFNWLVIYTEPGEDKMYEAQFYNRPDVDAWLESNQDKRAIVIYGRIEETEDHQ